MEVDDFIYEIKPGSEFWTSELRYGQNNVVKAHKLMYRKGSPKRCNFGPEAESFLDTNVLSSNVLVEMTDCGFIIIRIVVILSSASIYIC